MTLRGDARRREWLVIKLTWNAHVKIMFYLALRHVCLGRVHLSYQLHS